MITVMIQRILEGTHGLAWSGVGFDTRTVENTHQQNTAFVSKQNKVKREKVFA